MKLDFLNTVPYVCERWNALVQQEPAAVFLTEDAFDENSLKDAVAATGYTCLSVDSAPYEKKGWFKR